MKAIMTLLIASVTLAFAEPQVVIDLEPNEEGEYHDYSDQLVEKFNAILESDELLKGRVGGGSGGDKTAPRILQSYEDMSFDNDGGIWDYTQTLALYYSFPEGFHTGSQLINGVFAVFTIKGYRSYGQSYCNKAEVYKVMEHTVTAKFEGFRTTLNAVPKE